MKIKITKIGIITMIIALPIAAILVFFFYQLLPPHQCFESQIMMNPYGTGYQKITQTFKTYSDGTLAERAFETETGELIAYERCDKAGNQISGFKFKDGIYYEWVLTNPSDPSKSGQWQEKDPPSEVDVDRVNIFCHTRDICIYGTVLGLLLLELLIWWNGRRKLHARELQDT